MKSKFDLDVDEFKNKHIAQKNILLKINQKYNKIYIFTICLFSIPIAISLIPQLNFYAVLLDIFILILFVIEFRRNKIELSKVNITEDDKIKFKITEIVFNLKNYIETHEEIHINNTVKKIDELNKYIDNLMYGYIPMFKVEYDIKNAFKKFKLLLDKFYRDKVQTEISDKDLKQYISEFEEIYTYIECKDYKNLNYIFDDGIKVLNIIDKDLIDTLADTLYKTILDKKYRIVINILISILITFFLYPYLKEIVISIFIGSLTVINLIYQNIDKDKNEK